MLTRYAIYVKSENEASLRNGFCRGEVIILGIPSVCL